MKKINSVSKRYPKILFALHSAMIFIYENPKDKSVVEYKKNFCSFIRFLTGEDLGQEYINKMIGVTSLGKIDLSFMFVALEEIIKKAKVNEDQE